MGNSKDWKIPHKNGIAFVNFLKTVLYLIKKGCKDLLVTLVMFRNHSSHVIGDFTKKLPLIL